MSSSAPRAARRKSIIGLVLIFGTVLTGLLSHYVGQQEDQRIHDAFLSRARTQATLARERLRAYEEMIYSLRDSFVGQEKVTREEFTFFAGSLLQRHTGVKALQWVEIVPSNQRADFEQRIAHELGQPFVIRQRQADGRVQPAQPRPDHYVITFVEPLVGNELTLGYDVTSAPTAPLLERARQDRQFKVSQPFPLIQSDARQHGLGIVFILPVTDHGNATGPVVGFIQGVFHVRTLLSAPHQNATNEALDTYYLNTAEPSATPTLIYANLAGAEPLNVPLPTLDDPHDFHTTIPLGDRQLRLIIRLNPRWAEQAASSHPRLALAAGLIITLLLALLANTLLHRTNLVEHQVEQRTRELRASEARLQAIIDHSPAAIYLKDLSGRFLLCNEPFAKMCHRPVAAIPGHHCTELFPPDMAQRHHADDLAVQQSGTPSIFEESIPSPEGERFYLVHKFPLLDEQNHAYALCGIATDITDRKRADVELQENRRQLNSLISQLPGAAFRCLFDENLTTLFASEGMLALTGHPAADFIAGRIHLAALTVPADRETVRTNVGTALAARRNFEVEYRITHRDGTEKWVLVRGRPVYKEDQPTLRFIEGLAIDVTTLKAAEQEKIAFERNLQQVQKLESLGIMAGGIAHDFNNLLAAILGNANLVRLSLDPADPNQAQLEQIEQASRRAANLCNQMLAYAGKGQTSSGPLDLTHLVRETTAMLEVSIRKSHELIFQLAPDLPTVKADSAQLGQVVMNLVINASDAIGERRDGQITVTTFHRSVDASLFQQALHTPSLPGGLYVGLEVRDNGCGMTLDTLARIFEPFFTTKFSGRGLGLSAVLGIVQSHHGALFVESSPGCGATFRLLLPALPTPAPTLPTPRTLSPHATLNGTILVIDDEEGVRTMLTRMLQRQGATVLTAADGHQGLEVYHQHTSTIDLILLDLTMPGLSGQEVIQRLRDQSDQQKIMVMSGYSEEETRQHCAALGIVDFLRKPFDFETLARKLQRHLS